MRYVTSSCLAGALALLGSGAWAQSVISAHSGLVHFVEGRVLLDDKAIDPKFGQFPEIKPNQVLKAEDGRAEVLLSPGVFLRVGENSSVRMISNELTNTRIEVLSGRALVESATEATLKDDPVTVETHGDAIRILKVGLYEVFADPASLRVYQGEASVDGPNGKATIGRGHEADLTAKIEERKFDAADTDDLYAWTARRSGYIAAANVSSAQTMSNSNGYGYGTPGYGGFGYPGAGYGGFGYGYGGYGLGGFGYGMGMMGCNGWGFNPLFGMYTYVPCSGMFMDPFGYPFYSPYTVGYALPYYGGGGSASGLTPRSSRTPSLGRNLRNPRGMSASSPYTLAAMHSAARSGVAFARSSVSGGGGSMAAHGFSGGGFSGGNAVSVSSSSVSSMSSAGHAGGGGHK